MIQESRSAQIKAAMFSPLLGALLQKRREGLALVGAGALHLGLSLAGAPGWQCPIRAVTGVPCPGCGLTAATSALLLGDWRAALSIHAFAPLFLLSFIALATVSLLPEIPRQQMVARIALIETRTGVTAWVLLSLLIYWGLRLPVLLRPDSLSW
jgi:hypothetical protein